MKKNISDAELDQILKSVDEMVESLAKADPVKDEDDAPAMAPQAPAQEAPAPEANPEMEAPAQAAAPSEMAQEAPAQEAPAPEANPEMESPAAEEQEMENLSDEELQEIYASMPREEAERHFMILSEIVKAQNEPEAPAQEAPVQEQAVAPEMAVKSENKPKIAELSKAEKENQNLKKENQEMKKSLEIATRAIELALKPVRKSAATMADVQIIDKGIAEKKELSKEEIHAELDKKVADPSLTKSDRDCISNYFFTGDGKERILEIIGGKK